MKLTKKGSTKKRIIHNPDKLMRVLQWRLPSTYLNEIAVPEYIHGFEKGKSIPAMAAIHVNKRCVISLDIKDFFPSIMQAHVESLFRNIGFGEIPSWIASEICTYKAQVPQGALTSPKISCLVAAGTFGPIIAEYCAQNELNLSIYADDVTISFSRAFENRKVEGEFITQIIQTVTEALAKFRFRVNKEKTKVMWDGSRQWVCGAVVNRRVNLRKTERKNLRAMVFNCTRNGIPAEAAKIGMNDLAFIRKFGGRLNWFAQLNPEKAKTLRDTFFSLSRPLLKSYPDIEVDKLSWSSTLEDSDWEVVEKVVDEEKPALVSEEVLVDVGDFVTEAAVPF